MHNHPESPTNTYRDRTVLTVSLFNKKARQLLELSMKNVWIEGEISNLVRHKSGHWYFSLKDAEAQIRCVLFKMQYHQNPLDLTNGMQVLIRAQTSIYIARGDFQLIVQYIEPAGIGALYRQIEMLKQKLRLEGLLDESRKRALPNFPKNVGVISSPTGAVIQDIYSVFKRRCPLIQILLLPTNVQGKDAAEHICRQIKKAEQVPHLDVIIIARGGGSIEDLQPFNSESVAYTIAHCTLPVVSSIGHETDYTIADYVADYRAPTPSAAAEVLSPDQYVWYHRIDQCYQTLFGYTASLLSSYTSQLTHLAKRLKSPQDILYEKQQYIDHILSYSLHHLSRTIMEKKSHLHEVTLKIQQLHPKKHILMHRAHFEKVQQQFQQNIRDILSTKKQKLLLLCERMDAYNPLTTLTRGYSLAQNKHGEIIQNVQQATVGDTLFLTLAVGALVCTVTDKQLTNREKSASQS